VIDRLQSLLAHAQHVPADERAHFARALGERAAGGTLVVETCHRVELYGERGVVAEVGHGAPPGTQVLSGTDVARHLVRLAVGRESTVVGEDQVLHQLRVGVHAARRRGSLPSSLDRLADLALGAGRRARSWLPRSRPNLASAALERVDAAGWSLDGPVLVVGAGQMGRLAARALVARGVDLVLANRTPERGRALADELRARHVPFDPGAAAARELGGVILAIYGRWLVGPETEAALAGSSAWLVDLSAPPALDAPLRDAVAGRLLTIEDMAKEEGASEVSAGLLARLDALVEATLADYETWLAAEAQRDVARALAERAERARAAELDALWHRLPALDPTARAEVERMTEHLTRRLLREPMERLRDDGDGRQASAAREIFRL
jgi:glutamyl-tRNA reductase